MQRRSGFTLIELMVVVAIIAIIMAILIPGLLRARMAANETSAIGTIKTLTSSQEQFRNAAIVDVDGDGAGEYGYFQELTGVAPYRTGACMLSVSPSVPGFMTGALGQSVLTSGPIAIGNKSGYVFRIFLPEEEGIVGDGIREQNPMQCDADWANQQEQRWAVYGWPAAVRISGNSAFFGNRQSEIFFSDNVNGPMYDGTITAVDSGNAALPPGATNIDGNPSSLEDSQDFQRWRPVQ